MAVPVTAILDRKGGEVVTIGPQSTVEDAVQLLTEHGIGALVVSSDGSSVQGIISERDIVRQLASDAQGALRMSVAEVMTEQVTTCSPHETADDLMGTMTSGRIRHVPVMDEGQMVGIVSIGDVVKSRMDELELERAALEDYVSGGY